ncbi:MAG: metallophosphoesterase [Bdellovibrionales bacterium]|nr:metallophosphoesterase [Bdellovibrionales bacterium]
MENTGPQNISWQQAEVTVVLSDLHLCDAEPEHPKLWKKFKTKQFFFDDEFQDFLQHVDTKANGRSVELILNGDTFDFDSFMKQPEKPPYRVSWLEKHRGLAAEQVKATFKMREILNEHHVWVNALRDFILKGHRVVFIIGNHDLELHFAAVQDEIMKALGLHSSAESRVRFCNWFYISNNDTLIEHGNQYDPYCLCQDPINPMIQKGRRVEVRLPFGNLACRYMTNGMGFFNPHVDTNYIMSVREYLVFFFRYMIWNQPGLLWTWFWGACVTLWQTFLDGIRPVVKDPLAVEDQVKKISLDSNATERMVREMREISVHPASKNPFLLAQELWLDRAFFLVLAFVVLLQLFQFINFVYSISFYWMFVPLAIFTPFFLFYSQSVKSYVTKYKEPDETILSLAAQITGVVRIVYGHTHIPRHEMIGPVEHLNSGSWSPAFLDVECTKPFGKKTFVWVEAQQNEARQASLLEFEEKEFRDVFIRGAHLSAAR